MEARERLARIISDGEPRDYAHHVASLARVDAILAALHLSDDAALALMDGEGMAVPKEATPEMIAAGAGCIGARGVPWEAQQADCYRTHLSHSPYEDRDDR